MTLENEEKKQLQTKIKIEGTIDEKVFKEVKAIYETELKRAQEEDRAERFDTKDIGDSD